MTVPESSPSKDLTAEQFDELRDWIHQHSGIFLDSSQQDPLRISLVARATRLGFSDHLDYFELLKRDEREFKELMNLVTINETSFFRFPGQFDALRTSVVPEILEGKSKMSHTFRAWSAGCSTGEEPYTIAMSLLDSPLAAGRLHPRGARHRRVDAGARPCAGGGLPREDAREPSADGRREVVRTGCRGARPIAAVRDVVDFSYHNLIKEPYPLSLIGQLGRRSSAATSRSTSSSSRRDAW